MADLRLTDLDADPQLLPQVLALFAGCPPGHNHAVCGHPARMGLPPQAEDLREALGVLIALQGARVVGALALCPYSDEQVTLWGPVVHRGHTRAGVGTRLLDEARLALADGGYESIRVHVDTRNRVARSFFFDRGLAHWTTNRIYERRIVGSELPPDPGGVSEARPADHAEITQVIDDAFPESNHCREPLATRERQGYRHYFLQDAGVIVGAAAVQVQPGRGWIGFIGVRSGHRGAGYGSRLLAGLLHREAQRGTARLALEVLEQNRAAVRLYEQMAFHLAWKSHIMTGPV